MPAGRGQLTTVEGLLRDVAADLGIDQPVRKHIDPSTHGKIQKIIDGLVAVLGDGPAAEEDAEAGGAVVHQKEDNPEAPVNPFTIKLDDPSGNSFIEFVGSMADPKWNLRTYKRTREQNVQLGLVAPDEEAQPGQVATIKEEDEGAEDLERENEEIYVFPGICSSCGHDLNTMMKKVSIPYFKVRHAIMLSPKFSENKFTGYPYHVNKLRQMRLPRQRSQVWVCDLRTG